MKNARGVVGNSLLPILTVVFLFVLWQIAVKVTNTPVWFLPAPSDIVQALAERAYDLPRHTWATFYETVLGFGLAILVGVPLAAIVVSSKFISSTVYPLILITQSIPKVAFAPILLIWFGYGDLPKVIVVFLVAFFPVVVDTATGLMSPAPELLELARQLSAKPWQVYAKIRFPSALPYFFSGLKVAITLAVIGAVIGEFVGSDIGLGYLVIVSTANFKTPMAFGAMAILAVMGIVLFYAIYAVERVMIPWYGRSE